MSNVTSWLHDLRTPLMTILTNADHLGALAKAAPALREALERVALEPEDRRQLEMILEDLGPTAEDLASAANAIRDLVDRRPDR